MPATPGWMRLEEGLVLGDGLLIRSIFIRGDRCGIVWRGRNVIGPRSMAIRWHHSQVVLFE
jgi:hypothetical protein